MDSLFYKFNMKLYTMFHTTLGSLFNNTLDNFCQLAGQFVQYKLETFKTVTVNNKMNSFFDKFNTKLYTLFHNK